MVQTHTTQWLVVILCLFNSATAHFVHPHQPHGVRIFHNKDQIRAGNRNDFVNLHMLEVAEVTDPVQDRDLRSSVNDARSNMKSMTSSNCQARDIYRKIDGSCNNLKHPMWGTPMRKFRRLIHHHYDDIMGKPRYYRGSQTPLPSARTISLACHPPDSASTLESELSGMAMQWGQFLDHDITGTPETNKTKDCCEEMAADGSHPDYKTDGGCFPIFIEKGDRHFKNNCMEFRRSMPAEQYEIREQMNIITTYIDASQIYGSSPQEMQETRALHDGLLKEGDFAMLRMNASINRPCFKRDVGSCFFSGDVRVNEFPILTSMHTIFHREHNRLATELKLINPHWDDETLFQEARKIVAAYMQIITYDEFLPIILGPGGMRRYKLNNAYRYNKNDNPEIFNSFATAAYRFGHSMITRTFQTYRNRNQTIDRMFFRPSFLLNGSGTAMDQLMEGIVSLPCQKSDRFFTVGVTDHLFTDFPTTGISFDLAARNIQRGRDHGLAPYVEYYEQARRMYPDLTPGAFRYPSGVRNPVFTPPAPRRSYYNNLRSRFFNSFRGTQRYPMFPAMFDNPVSRSPRRNFYRERRTKRHGHGSGPTRARLTYNCQRAYNNRQDDVDLFVGGLSEDPVDDGLLGPTFAFILGKQFHKLKNSDRFWYETRDQNIGFTTAQRDELKWKTNLARIICDNTNVPHIQEDVFKIPSKRNPVVSCGGTQLPEINLYLWKDDIGPLI